MPVSLQPSFPEPAEKSEIGGNRIRRLGADAFTYSLSLALEMLGMTTYIEREPNVARVVRGGGVALQRRIQFAAEVRAGVGPASYVRVLGGA